MKMSIRTGLTSIAVCLALSACSTLTVQEEKKLGYEVQRQVRDQMQLVRDPVVVNYVRGIGQELVRASRPSPFEFRFYVIEDEEINAFAIPGGAVYVNTGLITKAANAAELAGVLAHEIGHVTSRHVAHMYRRQRNTSYAAQVFSILIAILSGNTYVAQGGQVATGVAAQAYLNTYTQDAESEADVLAVETMVRARYDPNALVTMLQTLQQETAGGFQMPQFLRSHPATSERIHVVSGLIRAQGSPQGLRSDDRKLAIIQERIRLIVGTDIEPEPDPI
jgi:predicted Zn-dependent protease